MVVLQKARSVYMARSVMSSVSLPTTRARVVVEGFEVGRGVGGKNNNIHNVQGGG